MRKRIFGHWGRWGLASACLFAVAGCGSDQNVVVGTTDVKGSVGGVVLEAGPGLAPMNGVQATVIAGGKTFLSMTDMNGVFQQGGVPAGNVVVHLAAEKHFDVYLNQTLNGSAGNFPIANPTLTVGPIALVSNTGVFKVRLVDETGAAPATPVKVTARATGSYIDLSSGNSQPGGIIEASGTSDNAGLVTIGPLPDYNGIGSILSDSIVVSVPPVALMGTGGSETYSFLGIEQSFRVRSLPGQTPTIVLAGPHTPIQVLSSNIDYFVIGGAATATPSLVKANGPINVVFNQAINPASVRAILYTDSGQLAAVQPAATVTGNVVSLGFNGKTLDPATRYNLELHASSLAGQSKEFNSLAPFFTPPDNGAMVTVSNISHVDANNPNDFILVFSEPVGLGNGSGANIPCVVFYEADLDGNSQVTSAGEWNPNGNSALKCNPNDPHIGYYLRPDEQSFGATMGAAITGFSSRWRIQVKPFQSVCVGNYQCCVGGAPVHLQFSRNPDGGSVLRRLNGAPVPDITFQLPPFQC